MNIDAVARTDIGRVRARNEDSFLIDSDASLFAVADGMGGHAAGDVASQTATSAFAAVFAETGSLLTAMKAANRAVIERATSQPELSGMGTTMTAIHFLDQKLRAAHVGDSRLYSLRAGRLAQLTRDHTVAQERVDQGTLTRREAMQHPLSSMLTRALGSNPDVAIDVFEESVDPGELFLLCSDGLTGLLSDEDILRIVQQRESIEDRAAELVATANARGGLDNITVLLAQT